MKILVYFIFLAVFGGALVWPALYNMVSLWVMTDTYLHGVLVIPLCAMVFRQMSKPAATKEAGTTAVILLSAAWLILLSFANQSFFNPLVQAVFISIIPILCYCKYGMPGLLHYRVPVLLTYLCIPFGDSLIPHLQSFTADMSVWLLQLSGVSVWRQGWYISIVNADFRVAEACSGVNFLISTIVLSVFFAFLEMSSWKKRMLFILMGILVPVLANGFRVYLIIMIAEMGYVEAATGFDHLVYGWIFFVVILLALGAIGLIMRDSVASIKTITGSTTSEEKDHTNLVTASFFSAALSVALFFIYMPSNQNGVVEVEKQGRLGPVFEGADGYCFSSMGNFETHRIYYSDDNHNKKMLSINNRWFDGSRWTVSNSSITPVADYDTLFTMSLTSIRGENSVLVGRYVINGIYTSKTWEAKVRMWINNVLRRDIHNYTELALLPPGLDVSSWYATYGFACK